MDPSRRRFAACLSAPRVRARSGPASARGFCLIEVLIVIAIIAIVSAVSLPSLTSVFRTSREGFARKLALTLREARDRALLRDKLLRLRINLDTQEYWFEEAPGSYLRPKPPSADLTKRDQAEAEKKESEAWRNVTELAADKVKIPTGLKITDVDTPRRRGGQKEGTVDVYFYNNGNTDGAQIHFEDEEKIRQTIQLNAVTGQSKLLGGAGEAEAR